MKTKIFLLTLLLFSVLFAKGQDYTYIPFVEEDTKWSYAFITWVGYDLRASYATYQLKGDTIISGLNYKKLYEGCSEDYCIAALREENKKVFIKEFHQDEERLFYDFNLQEGDNMIGYSGHEWQVISIDTVQIGNTKRKRFDFYGEIWIEGIGAIEDFYPLRARLLVFADQGINYQKKGSEIVYKTDEWYFNENECTQNAIQSPLSSGDCVIQVQEGAINIRFFTKETVQISLSDTAGRMYYHSPSLSATDVTIPSQSFPKGIYLLKIVNPAKNQTNIRKIILYP